MKKILMIAVPIVAVIIAIIVALVARNNIIEANTYHPIRHIYSGSVVSVSANDDGTTQIVLDSEPDKVFTDDKNEYDVKVGDCVTIDVEERYNMKGFDDNRSIIELEKRTK